MDFCFGKMDLCVTITYNVILRYLVFVSRCYSLLPFYNELLLR